MDRRQFVKASTAATAVAATKGLRAQAQTATRPNILYIFSDQHRAMSVSGTRGAQVQIKTPNLDGMKAAGIEMKNSYSNCPLCSPHRAILQTGIWPNENGMTGNVIQNGTQAQINDIAQLDVANVTVAQTLQTKAGYKTGYCGKWDLGQDPGKYLSKTDPTRFNYDEWMVWYNVNAHYVGNPTWTAGDGNVVTQKNSPFFYDPATSQAAFLFSADGSLTLETAKGQWSPHYQTLQATDFIKRNSADPNTPWILFVSYNVPHPKMDPPNGTLGYPAYDSSAAMKTRPNMTVSDTTPTTPDNSLNQIHSADDLKAWADPTMNTSSAYLDNYSDTVARTYDYYGGITDIDQEVGILIDLIANDATLKNNTIIIYASDHGDMMGSHSLAGKQFPHEESSNVPFYVQGPGIAVGKQYAGLFSTIDIAPTLCGLAGVTFPTNYRGKDFSSVLKGASDLSSPNQFIFLLNGHGIATKGNGDSSFDGYFASPVYRGLRTAQYTYACVATGNLAAFQTKGAAHANVGPYTQGHWLLFDNNADTFQNRNLITLSGMATSYPSTGAPAFTTFQQQLNVFIGQNVNPTRGADTFTSPVL